MAVVGVDGSGRRALAVSPRPKYGPVWSPDGTEVAFGVCAELQCTPEVDVVAGGRARRALRGTIGWPATWSADGTLLAGAGGLDRATHEPTHVVVAAPDGSAQRALAATAVPPPPSFAPRGHLIAYFCRPGLCLVDARGGPPRAIPRSTPPGDHLPLAWSPDGRLLAFAVATADGYGSALMLYDVRRRGTRALATLPTTLIFDLRYAPDGSRIALDTNDGAAIATTASRPHLTRVAGHKPVWSRDGSRLAVVGGPVDGRQELDVVHADGTGRGLLVRLRAGRTATPVGFARDGRLVYESG